MTTVFLGSSFSPYSGVLGASWFRRKLIRPVKKASGVVKRNITRPVSRVTQKVWSPVDRNLKKVPVVRTIYAAAKTATYAHTLQFKETKQAGKRTIRSVKKDVAAVKNLIRGMADKLVWPIVQKIGREKGAAALKKSGTVISAAVSVPLTAAVASNPTTAPFAALVPPTIIAAVRAAINKFISMAVNVVKRIAVKTGIDAQKFPSLRSESSAPNYFDTEDEAPEKPGFNPLMLAPLLFFL
jgi:hypothetical protein